MDKAFEIQRQARDNVKTLQTYLTDLQNWEAEMKRKEAALNGEFEQELPPIRSKIKKEKSLHLKKNPEKRIAASDYKSWDNFDVDKACADIDMADVGPVSLDSKNSELSKMEKLRQEAQHEKERGNAFVKQEKWNEAITCYSRAIELVKNDAIYFANRGLCYLKKDSLHQAESDCTEAIKIDPTYVKAFQRRASAREKLGSLRSASQDLNEVLRLEPHNSTARRQLDTIKSRMGTKGTKSKSSPNTTPNVEQKSISLTVNKDAPIKAKILDMPDNKVPVSAVIKEVSAEDKWKDGIGENVTILKTVTRPPHLRSKRPLKNIKINEIPLGKTTMDNPPTRMKIIEIDDNLSHGDTNNNDFTKTEEISKNMKNLLGNDIDGGKGDVEIKSPESAKLVNNELMKESLVSVNDMVAPSNSVQFMSDWKNYGSSLSARGDYLSIIDPLKIPSIFSNALEGDVLSDILKTLYNNTDKYREKTIVSYLHGISRVKRFAALAMFLTNTDRDLLKKLLEYCRTVEKCTDAEITELKNKYEL